MNRRSFVTRALAFSLTPSIGRALAKTPKDSLVIVASSDEHVTCFFPDLGTVKRVIASVPTHSFAIHPAQRDKVIAFSKGHPKLLEVDPFLGKVSTEIVAPKGYFFYGHGSFSPNNQYLAATLIHSDLGTGHVAIYDSSSYRLLAVHLISKGGVHQCQYLNDRKIAVTSTGVPGNGKLVGDRFMTGERIEPSALNILDLENKDKVQKFEIPDLDQLLGHFEFDGKNFLLLSTPWVDGEVNTRKIGGALYFLEDKSVPRKIQFPPGKLKQIKGEMLSVVPTSEGYLVTNPYGELFFKINKIGKYIGSYSGIFNGVGVDNQNEGIILSPQNSSSFSQFNMKTEKYKSWDLNHYFSSTDPVVLDSGHCLVDRMKIGS